MKIQKFYENVENIWSKEKVVNFLRTKEEVEQNNRELNSLMNQYLSHNNDLLPKRLQDAMDYDGEDFWASSIYLTGGDKIYFNVYWDDGDEKDTVMLTSEKTEDFFYFLSNIETYKDTKKYNL